MTTERLYLLLTAILTGALWIPVVIGYVSSRGMLKSSDYKVARAFKFGGGGRGILHWQMGKARVAMRTLRDCYASLSRREQQVMALVVSGLLNKQVGGELGISEITVKAHRGNVMARDSRFTSDSRFVNGSLFRRDEPGNIVKPNKSFRGENSGNWAKILPAVLAKIVAWRGFPAADRMDC